MSQLIVSRGECRIPAIGFGTYKLDPGLGTEAVATALSVGYRHIDAAQLYDNEAEVGEALAASGIPRQELFVATKVRADRNAPGRLPPLGRAQPARSPAGPGRSAPRPLAGISRGPGRRRSRRCSRPRGAAGPASSASATSTARSCAKPRSVAGGTLVTNQVEYHPFLDQTAMLAELRRQGMILSAYSPAGARTHRAGRDDRRDRRAAWPQCRPDRAALAGPAGRRGGSAQGERGGAHARQPGRVRLRAERRRDGRDLRSRLGPAAARGSGGLSPSWIRALSFYPLDRDVRHQAGEEA